MTNSLKIRSSSSAGVSLLDFLVSIAIIAFAAATASMALRQQLDSYRGARADLSRLVTNIQRALIAAQQHEVKSEIIVKDTSYSIILPGEAGEEVPLGPNSKFETAEVSDQTLSFYPSGITSPRTIVISDDAARCTTVIALYGRIRSFCVSVSEGT
jgi:hypothetical protein